MHRSILRHVRCLLIMLTVFGMNVGGVPWTGQKDPKLMKGFRNVMLLCVAMLVLVLLCFLFSALYTRIDAWRRRGDLKRSWSFNRRFSRKSERAGYLRI